ncbi:MAG: hypothetical protein IPG02_01100 [Ignavibacteria bacterium]|jgi:hypothetical protein|nr:hypothetical protein [Ignavibacteria bacterium]MBK6878127.1 hypothetical protein [Ignavibacteria bacterium]MBK9226420.1 hypothetical protein [Ignavibacteria bacterium]
MKISAVKFVCIWSLEIVFGKQREAMKILKAWGEEKFRSSNFKVSKNRMMNGYVGESPSLILDEYLFDSLEDFEKALSDMSQPQFSKFAEDLAQYVVPGSQKWKIYKVIN